ncbi:hypothetical protein [Chlorogloeopsis sp. ULAP02]
MNQQLPQFIHRVVDRLQSIQGITVIALAILEKIEQDLSQWYGDRRVIV